MPLAAPRPCTQPGCGVLVRDGTGRCASHKVREGSFADSRRGSRHERGYGTQWDKLRVRILERDAGVCQPCLAIGIVHPGNEVDHRISKAQWKRRHGNLKGVDDEGNLQAINRECHKAKTARERNGAQGGSENFRMGSARTDRKSVV